MADKSATQVITQIATEGNFYSLMHGGWDKITVEWKNGDMAEVIWYQLWRNGRVILEINSRYVVEVTYLDPESEDLPF